MPILPLALWCCGGLAALVDRRRTSCLLREKKSLGNRIETEKTNRLTIITVFSIEDSQGKSVFRIRDQRMPRGFQVENNRIRSKKNLVFALMGRPRQRTNKSRDSLHSDFGHTSTRPAHSVEQKVHNRIRLRLPRSADPLPPPRRHWCGSSSGEFSTYRHRRALIAPGLG